MSKLRIFTIIAFFIIILPLFSVQPVSPEPNLSQEGIYSEPTGYYQVSADNDLPPVNPLGIKEDQFGNIHTWYYYLRSISQFQTDQRLTLYYNIAFQNGSNFLRVISVEQTSMTKFSLLQKQSLVETSNGGVYTIFIQTTDFGVNLVHVSWDPDNGFEISSLDYPDVDPIGSVIGPVETSNSTKYFIPVADNSGRSILQVTFDDGEFQSIDTIAYPTISVGSTQIGLAEIFDITYANESIFYLGSFAEGSGTHSLQLVKTFSNGSTSAIGARPDVNVAPVLGGVTFFSAIRQDIIKPQLVSTDDGQLFTFLFSLSEENQINDLVKWTNSTGEDVFADADEDPFLISFLPSISAVGNNVKIASLGIQIAQDIFTIAIDYFTYNPNSNTLQRDKIQDSSFSSDFFFFAIDFTSDSNLGIAGTISIPSYLKDKNQILNDTVGALILFSNAGLPDVDPYFVNVAVENKSASQVDEGQDISLVIVIGSTMLILIISIFVYWRISVLNQVKIEDFQDIDNTYRQSNFFNKLRNFVALLVIHIRANWRRYVVTVIALIIPVLLLLSLFTGLLSHQDYLIQSYESQNSLNDSTNPNLPSSDFIWQRSLYDDEFANNTISPTQWGLAEQLTSTVIQRNGVASTVSNLTATTVFPLFEKRLGYFINDQGQNQSVNYPFAHDMAVIDTTWTDYLSENLLDGRLPQAPNEVLIHEGWFVRRDLFSPRYDFGNIYDVGSELELFGSEIDIFLNSSLSGLSQNLTIVGIIDKAENQPVAEIEAWADRLGTTVKALRFLDEIPIYLLPNLASDLLNNFARLSLRPTTYVNLRYDVFSLDRDEIPLIIDNYKGMLNRTFQETGIPWIGEFVDNRVITFLEGYFSASNNIQLEATVIVIPVLGLILLLNYEALGIGRSSLEEEIARHKQEGMRTENLIVFFIFERLLTTVTAVLVATGLTPLVTPHLLSFTGFFETNARITPPQLLELLPVMALIIFAILWVSGVILSISYFLKLEDWRYQQYVSGFRGDIVIIVISTSLIGLSAFISGVFEEQLNLSNPEDALNSNVELIFLSIRMISLLLGTFGAVLIFSKVLNLLFIALGKLIWTIKRTRVTLPFNGISSSMGVYGKLLVIFTIAFFLIVPMVVVPQSLQAQYVTDAYGELSTDITGTDWHTLSSETQEMIADMSEISQFSPYFFGTIEFANNLQIRTLAINSTTFDKSIILPEKFADQFGISSQDYSDLGENEILTNQQFIERNPVDIGDSVSLGFSHLDDQIELTITAAFNNFPILKYELAGVDTSESVPLQMVLSMETLDNLQSYYETNITEESSSVAEQMNQRQVAIRVDQIDNVDELTAKIRELSGMRMEKITDYILDQQHPFFRIFEFVSHLSIIVGIIAPLLSTLIFSNILFERRKFELEVYKRNGLSNIFFLRQMSIELTLASLIPSLSGLFIGSWWSAYYGTELFGKTSQDIIWVFNPVIIWGYTAFILVVSLGIWIVRIHNQIKNHVKEVRL